MVTVSLHSRWADKPNQNMVKYKKAKKTFRWSILTWWRVSSLLLFIALITSWWIDVWVCLHSSQSLEASVTRYLHCYRCVWMYTFNHSLFMQSAYEAIPQWQTCHQPQITKKKVQNTKIVLTEATQTCGVQSLSITNWSRKRLFPPRVFKSVKVFS